MKPLSLKDRILKYIRNQYPNKVAKGAIQRLVVHNTKYTPENAGRRLRELENEKLVEVSYEKNHAFYKAPEPKSVEIIRIPELNKEIIQKIWQ